MSKLSLAGQSALLYAASSLLGLAGFAKVPMPTSVARMRGKHTNGTLTYTRLDSRTVHPLQGCPLLVPQNVST
jgi:hypothetical protein